MKKLLLLALFCGFLVTASIGCGTDTPKKDTPKAAPPAGDTGKK